MYMIFRSIQTYSTLPNSSYSYLSSFNLESTDYSTFYCNPAYGNNYSLKETSCRVDGKYFKVWSSSVGIFENVEQAFQRVLEVVNFKKNYFIFENLQDAINAVNNFQNSLLEEMRVLTPENRPVVNYYIIRINMRQIQIIKNVPADFLEISHRVDLNFENIPADLYEANRRQQEQEEAEWARHVNEYNALLEMDNLNVDDE